MRTLTGIRPSLWARCVTAAVFQGRGEIEAEPPAEVKEFFFRGHVFEEIVMRQIEAKHGKHNVQRQVVIPIPGIGEGHADGYLIPEKALIEVKSTTGAYPNSPTFDYGANQLRRYIAYHPEAEKGLLYMVDPGRMKPAEIYTVVLTDADRDRIEQERQAIVRAVEMPELVALDPHGSDVRPCVRPTQARGRMCPFAEACFEHWEAPDTPDVTDRDALLVVAELAAIKANETEHRKALAALEQERKDAQSRLGELVPVGDSIVGPYAVKRIHKTRQPSFSAKAYEAAGHSLEPLAEFFRGGSEWDEYRIGEAHANGTVDFGEEAPW